MNERNVGERNPRAKLTVEKVQQIRLRYHAGGCSQESLAAEYGITGSVIGRVVKSLSWKHVGNPKQPDAIASENGERWLPVVGWEAYYEVSDLGRVRRSAPGKGAFPGRILCPRKSRKGYLRVALHGPAGRIDKSIHVAVMEAFACPQPAENQVNHKNGDKSDNRLLNLEWVTGSENMRHAFRLGLNKGLAGERNGRAKLTADQVREIRSLLTNMSDVQLAKRFGVSSGLIWFIRAGKCWQSVA